MVTRCRLSTVTGRKAGVTMGGNLPGAPPRGHASSVPGSPHARVRFVYFTLSRLIPTPAKATLAFVSSPAPDPRLVEVCGPPALLPRCGAEAVSLPDGRDLGSFRHAAGPVGPDRQLR